MFPRSPAKRTTSVSVLLLLYRPQVLLEDLTLATRWFDPTGEAYKPLPAVSGVGRGEGEKREREKRQPRWRAANTHRTPAEADTRTGEAISKRLHDGPFLMRTEPTASEGSDVCRRARHLLANREHRMA